MTYRPEQGERVQVWGDRQGTVFAVHQLSERAWVLLDGTEAPESWNFRQLRPVDPPPPPQPTELFFAVTSRAYGAVIETGKTTPEEAVRLVSPRQSLTGVLHFHADGSVTWEAP